MRLYKHKSFVHTQLDPKEKVSSLFVLLPVFHDHTTNEYGKPKDLDTLMDQSHNMDSVTLTDNTETLANHKEHCFEPPLWGLDRNFKVAYNTGNLDYLSSERLAKAFIPPSPLPLPSNEHIPMLQDFPTLKPTAAPPPVSQRNVPYKPIRNLNKPKPRRVLRIIPQKSSAPSPTTPQPSFSLMER